MSAWILLPSLIVGCLVGACAAVSAPAASRSGSEPLASRDAEARGGCAEKRRGGGRDLLELLADATRGEPVSLDLTIEEAHSGAHSGRVELLMHLRNPSGRPVWINRRFRLGPKDGSDRELWLDAVSVATGEAAIWRCFLKGAPPSVQDYIVLLGFDEYASVVSASCYKFGGAGPWLVTGHYQDGGDGPSERFGVPEFRGVVTSNTITITLE